MAISAGEPRTGLFPLVEQMNAGREPVDILSKGGTAFLASEAQFRAMAQTSYSLRPAANARRVPASIAGVGAGPGRVRELLDA